MTKQEAISLMQSGHKVKHYLFSDDEYIHMKNGKIYDEKGYLMESDDARGNFIDFWTDRNDEIWKDGWTSLDHLEKTQNEFDITSGASVIYPLYNIYQYSSDVIETKNKRNGFISKNSHKRTNFRKK